MAKIISMPLIEVLRLEFIAARERRDRLRAELREAQAVLDEHANKYAAEHDANDGEED